MIKNVLEKEEVVVTQHYGNTKCYWIVHCKTINFMLYEWHLNFFKWQKIGWLGRSWRTGSREQPVRKGQAKEEPGLSALREGENLIGDKFCNFYRMNAVWHKTRRERTEKNRTESTSFLLTSEQTQRGHCDRQKKGWI